MSFFLWFYSWLVILLNASGCHRKLGKIFFDIRCVGWKVYYWLLIYTIRYLSPLDKRQKSRRIRRAEQFFQQNNCSALQLSLLSCPLPFPVALNLPFSAFCSVNTQGRIKRGGFNLDITTRTFWALTVCIVLCLAPGTQIWVTHGPCCENFTVG